VGAKVFHRVLRKQAITMADEFLGDRRKALEESFFQKQDRILMEKLKAQVLAEETKQGLAIASGLHDPAVLEALVDLGLNAKTVAALTLAPLVEVAWASPDGVSKKERAAILQAAEAQGVTDGTPAHTILEDWLTHRPGPELLQAWKEYVVALRQSTDPKVFEQLRDEILDRAEGVAQAAGGFLGLASVSSSEKAMLAELEKAFRE
jgi:hypothetical protein